MAKWFAIALRVMTERFLVSRVLCDDCLFEQEGGLLSCRGGLETNHCSACGLQCGEAE